MTQAAVRDWLGHHDVSTTDRYLATDGARLQEAARKMEGMQSSPITPAVEMSATAQAH